MIKKLKNIVVGVIFLISFSIIGQVHPVQVSPQMIPPYSLKLSDFNTSSSEKIIATILLTDVVEQNMQVGIRIYIENGRDIKIQSAPLVIGSNPIYLRGGIPLRLSNLDLRPYFQLQNLYEISPEQYSQPLPDGLYQFCFEVYEWSSGQVLSRKSCAAAYLVLNDPPILNMPGRGVQIAEKNVQNIVFQWTPRHLNATNVQYEFTLAELWDPRMDPQAAFLASRPLYQTTLRANTLLYGPGETALLPNKVYAWRVRALVSDGISETSVFRNDGHSEIFHFTHVGKCFEPKYVMAQADIPTREKIMWEGNGHLNYQLQVRKKSTSASVNDWYKINTQNEYTTVTNLDPGTIYEFRVGGQCIVDGDFTFSQIYEFTTIIPEQNSTYNCGITPELVISNKNPLEQLAVGDVFTAGDFPVTVNKVSGDNGTFSGVGYITVPYLLNTKIGISFNNIKINTDKQLIEGMVLTDYDAEWGTVVDGGEVIDDAKDILDTVLETLESAVNEVRNGDLTGEGLDGLINEIDDDLPTSVIDELKGIKNEVVQLEEAYENAETEEEKEQIQEQINALNEQFADVIDSANDKIVNQIIKAIEKYYNQNKSQESSLISQYDAMFGSPTASSVDTGAEPLAENNTSDFRFEGEVFITDLPAEFEQMFDLQEKYHLYFMSKAIAENKDDKETIRLFIKKTLETDVDLIKIVNESQDQENGEEDTLNVLVKAIDKSFKTIIDSQMYYYLNE